MEQTTYLFKTDLDERIHGEVKLRKQFASLGKKSKTVEDRNELDAKLKGEINQLHQIWQLKLKQILTKNSLTTSMGLTFLTKATWQEWDNHFIDFIERIVLEPNQIDDVHIEQSESHSPSETSSREPTDKPIGNTFVVDDEEEPEDQLSEIFFKE